nr:competence type IV pilus minor pilin ComGF [Streptococcus sp. S784/96/1]
MLRKIKLPAFTLLECLVSLLVIIGSVQVYQGLTQVLSHQVNYLSDNRQEEWLLFCQQLQAEFDGTKFIKLENNKLYLSKNGQKLAFGQSKKDDFRKTNADGRGYQPMIFGLKSSAISQEENLVTINLTFDNGLERSFVYAFEKTR